MSFAPQVNSKVEVAGKALGEYARIVIRMKPGPSIANDFQEALIKFARTQAWAVMVGTPPKTKKERALTETLAEIRGGTMS